MVKPNLQFAEQRIFLGGWFPFLLRMLADGGGYLVRNRFEWGVRRHWVGPGPARVLEYTRETERGKWRTYVAVRVEPVGCRRQS